MVCIWLKACIYLAMKFLKLILLFLTLNSYATDLTKSSLWDTMPKQMTGHWCIQGPQLYNGMNLQIVRKIDKRHYELAGFLSEENKSIHGILKTKVSEPRRTGMIMLRIKHVGIKEMPLDNGFSTVVDLWEECTAND